MLGVLHITECSYVCGCVTLGLGISMYVYSNTFMNCGWLHVFIMFMELSMLHSLLPLLLFPFHVFFSYFLRPTLAQKGYGAETCSLVFSLSITEQLCFNRLKLNRKTLKRKATPTRYCAIDICLVPVAPPTDNRPKNVFWHAERTPF